MGSTVILLGVVSLLTDISSESVSAILPLYLTAVVGLSPLAYGFIDGLYQGVSALVRIPAAGCPTGRTGPSGSPSSATGSPRSPRLPALPRAGAAAVTAVVTVDRIGKGLRTAPRDAMIAASTPEHLGRAFGVHRALDTTGAAIGPLMAFAILWSCPAATAPCSWSRWPSPCRGGPARACSDPTSAAGRAGSGGCADAAGRPGAT